MRLLYLGISGVLHPSETTYRLAVGLSPWEDGHAEYEAVPWLERVVNQWHDVRIIITSTQPWSCGLPAVLAQLGSLAKRVDGFTFDDLTTKPVRQVVTRSGTSWWSAYSSADYWRMSKSDIVAAHVAWSRPNAWVAADDEAISWPPELASHVCIVNGCKALLHPAQQDRLLTCLHGNFDSAGRAEAGA
jgi:hypothetical protein